MKTISRRDFLKASVVAAGGLVAGCAGVPGPSPRPSGEEGKPITFVEGTDVTTLDPTVVSDTPTWGIIMLVYDTLVTWDEDMRIIPSLATGWTLSDDRRTWTFDLHPDVKFSDGSPFNAEAVKFSIERTLDPKTGSVVRAIFEGVIEKVEPVSASRVRITTKAPYPDLLIILASPTAGIYSPSATTKYDVKEYGRHPVGTVPYLVDDWVPGERLVLVTNPNFWGPRPRTPRIIFRPVPDAATRAAMLRTGEADIVVKIPPEEVRNLEAIPDVQVLRLDSMYQVSFELNVAKDMPPLKDRRVRQALNHAVDKDAIARNILQNFGQPIRSPFGPGIDFRVEFEPYRYDPQRARQLLAEAGYPSGFPLELWSPQGRYLKDREVAEAVQGYLRAVGIDASLRIWEWAPYTQAVRVDESRQAMLLGRATPGADFFCTRLFTKGAIGQFNSTNFWTPELEELIPRARSTFDEQERARLYRQIQTIVWEEAPWIFLYNQKALVGIRRNVTGFKMWKHEVMLLRDVVKS